MPLKQKIKSFPFVYNTILFFLNKINYFNFQFRRKFPHYQITPYWSERLEKVMQSADNEKIDHIENAGMIFNNFQLMHNGIKITLGSYYDYGNTVLLEKNRGVHEPQEEYVFQEVLRHIPQSGSMMELGSYWAFYSLWFASAVKNATCFMVEPDPHKMNFGKLNFSLNCLHGTFLPGFIGGQFKNKWSIPVYSVDFLIKKFQINFLSILHSDIQGYELKMLEGAEDTLRNKKVGYFFISTHSNELHKDCILHLKNKGYEILCEADLDRSFSVDGLIVAKLPGMPGPSHIVISKRN